MDEKNKSAVSYPHFRPGKEGKGEVIHSALKMNSTRGSSKEEEVQGRGGHPGSSGVHDGAAADREACLGGAGHRSE